jgi:Malectin domain/Right handed beta helix region
MRMKKYLAIVFCLFVGAAAVAADFINGTRQGMKGEIIMAQTADADTVAADDTAHLGELLVEPATYNCLGFQWQGEGDDNENATCALAYRKVGANAWQDAMPLVRLRFNPIEPKVLFAGSIIDLDPGTEYECKLTVSDPDGVEGDAERTVRCRTRAEVVIPEGMAVRHVYPQEYTGRMPEGSYKGLLHAIRGGNRYTSAEKKVKGGEILLLHAGVYKGKRFDKRDGRGHLQFMYPGWHGFPLRIKATAEKPLVIKAAGDGEVVIDGDGMPEGFDLRGAKHVIIEGITFQNCGMTLHLSDPDVVEPSEDITIRNCIFRDIAFAACGMHTGNRNVTISDCRISGRQQAVIGSWGYRTSGEGVVQILGRGHVYRYNHVVDVFDFTNFWGDQCSAADVHNNDIQRVSDNALPAQGFCRNVRFLRNRIFNGGDPQFDTRNQVGPIYYIRNIVYNQREGRAFKTDGGIGGLIALHNTITCHPIHADAYRYGRIHNNLFLESKDQTRGRSGALAINTEACADFDYNGYLTKGAKFLIDKKPCADFADFRKKSGLEAHGVEVDYSIFEKAVDPRSLPVDRPNWIPIIDPETVDLRLKEGSAAVDAGKVIANVNEDFNGKAPDLGAYERGKPLPHYGPRQPFPEPYRMKEPGKELAGPLPKAPGKPVIRVNCGSPAAYEDPAGNVWHADQLYKWPNTWGYIGCTNTWWDQDSNKRGKSVQNTALTQMYRFENGEVNSYHFKVEPGAYTVRLHFADRWGGYKPSVSVNGKLAFKEFDIEKEAGGTSRAVYRDVPCKTETGLISIDFAPIGKINGIEIFITQD